MFEPDERAAADEQHVARIHLDVLLLGMLAPSLGRNVGDGSLEHLQERLLDALARDVAGDRHVVGRLADLVDLVDVDDAALGRLEIEVGGVQQLEQDVLDVLADVAGLGQRRGVADGEGDVEDSRQGRASKRLAAAGRADQEDVRLVELDLLVGLFAVDQPLVMVMQGDGKDLLGPILADHVGVELVLDLPRGRDVGEQRLGHTATTPLLVEDRLAELDAFAADVDISGAFDQRADVAEALAAEGAIGVFLRAPRGSRGHASSAVPLSTAPRATPRDVLTRWHAAPFHPKHGPRSPREFRGDYVARFAKLETTTDHHKGTGGERTAQGKSKVQFTPAIAARSTR